MNDLFNEFEAITEQQWKERLQKDLKGVTFEALQVTDRNGIVIDPFYTLEGTGEKKVPVFTAPDWEIAMKVEVDHVSLANRNALENLRGGVSALHFVMDAGVDLPLLLKDIDLSIITSFFEINENPATFHKQLSAWMHSNNVPETARIFICYDPLMTAAAVSEKIDGSCILKKAFFSDGNSVYINGSVYNNAGANSITECSMILAHLNEYLNVLNNEGSISSLQYIIINVAVDTLFFEQVSKLRALRQLTGIVLKEYNIRPQVHIHAETSDVYRAAADVHSNLLRDSVSGMAAVIGGCDSLAIHAFNATGEANSNFGNRMSRNQQLLFKEESYLQQVADAACGSYYLEQLTEDIAAKSWDRFLEIEKAGGWLIAYNAGKLMAEVGEQAASLVEDYKTGKRTLIGVNKYRNPDEKGPVKSLETFLHKGFPKLKIEEALAELP